MFPSSRERSRVRLKMTLTYFVDLTPREHRNIKLQNSEWDSDLNGGIGLSACKRGSLKMIEGMVASAVH